MTLKDLLLIEAMFVAASLMATYVMGWVDYDNKTRKKLKNFRIWFAITFFVVLNLKAIAVS